MELLCTELINNKEVAAENPTPTAGPSTQSSSTGWMQIQPIICKGLSYQQSVRICIICADKARTHWKCTCGDYVCPPQESKKVSKGCYVEHIRYRLMGMDYSLSRKRKANLANRELEG